MAIVIPPVIKKGATNGERWLLNFLRDNLPEECTVYYEAFILGVKMDITIIIPSKGILVIEAKDYRMSTILEANTDVWKLSVEGQEKTVVNPLDQARSYAFKISNVLTKDKHLMHKGKLSFLYGFCTMWTNITESVFIENGLDQVIPVKYALFRDKLNEEPSSLLETLEGMFVYSSIARPMSLDMIDRTRFHLFPEVRIGSDYNEEQLLGFDTIKSMSIYQETLAKQLGEGNRLIRGVSGSGKTLILVARAKLLAKEHPHWKILIVCFGVVLASSLRNMISFKEYPNVEVYPFNEFIKNAFGIYHEDKIQSSVWFNTAGYLYDAILIDEAQDFDGDWIKLLANCISQETKSLLLAEDRAQLIFRRKTSLSQTTGMDFRGRSRVLTINYRNTRKVMQFAWDFYNKFISTVSNEVIEPKATHREGVSPLLMPMKSVDTENLWIASEILSLVARGVSPHQIGILYRVKSFKSEEYISSLLETLSRFSVDYQWVSESRDSKSTYRLQGNKVNVLTMDSSKGLDFRVVFIVHTQNTPFCMEKDKDREVSLMYIAMTRATELLYLSWSGKSEYTDYFLDVKQNSLGELNSSDSF